MRHTHCHRLSSAHRTGEARLIGFAPRQPERQPDRVKVADDLKGIERLNAGQDRQKAEFAYDKVEQRVAEYRSKSNALKAKLGKLTPKDRAAFDKAEQLLRSTDRAKVVKNAYNDRITNKLSSGEEGLTKAEKKTAHKEVFYRVGELETLFLQVEEIIQQVEAKIINRGGAVEKTFEDEMLAKRNEQLDRQIDGEEDLRSIQVDSFDKPFTSIERRAYHLIRLPADANINFGDESMREGKVAPINSKGKMTASTGDYEVIMLSGGAKYYKFSPEAMQRLQNKKVAVERSNGDVVTATLLKIKDTGYDLDNVVLRFEKPAPPPPAPEPLRQWYEVKEELPDPEISVEPKKKIVDLNTEGTFIIKTNNDKNPALTREQILAGTKVTVLGPDGPLEIKEVKGEGKDPVGSKDGEAVFLRLKDGQVKVTGAMPLAKPVALSFSFKDKGENVTIDVKKAADPIKKDTVAIDQKPELDAEKPYARLTKPSIRPPYGNERKEIKAEDPLSALRELFDKARYINLGSKPEARETPDGNRSLTIPQMEDLVARANAVLEAKQKELPTQEFQEFVERNCRYINEDGVSPFGADANSALFLNKQTQRVEVIDNVPAKLAEMQGAVKEAADEIRSQLNSGKEPSNIVPQIEDRLAQYRPYSEMARYRVFQENVYDIPVKSGASHLRFDPVGMTFKMQNVTEGGGPTSPQEKRLYQVTPHDGQWHELKIGEKAFSIQVVGGGIEIEKEIYRSEPGSGKAEVYNNRTRTWNEAQPNEVPGMLAKSLPKDGTIVLGEKLPAGKKGYGYQLTKDGDVIEREIGVAQGDKLSTILSNKVQVAGDVQMKGLSEKFGRNVFSKKLSQTFENNHTAWRFNSGIGSKNDFTFQNEKGTWRARPTNETEYKDLDEIKPNPGSGEKEIGQILEELKKVNDRISPR